MANPAPTINQINAFNATQGTTIDFNIIGGTELVRSNRIYIYDLSDNSLICTHLYASTESIHELPPNTDGSIVYESGKSSADFVNGAQYYAQIQTFTDIGGTEGGSGLSVAKMFWCLDDPTLTIDTIPSTISTTSYNVSATYDANTSVVSNIIQQYQFSLYSATGSPLQSSGVVVGNGEQQGTSTAYDISYNFTGLSVGSSYYVVVDVTTTQGMSVSVQSGTFTVSIDTPTLGEATVVNNACDGYISVTSNLSSEYGGSGSGEIVSFETDSENVFTKLQVTFSPTQTGSGTPSPSNVRPIYGVGGVAVNKSGKNLFGGQYNTRFNVFIPANTAFTASAKHTSGSARIDYFDVDGNRIDWFGLTAGSERDTRTITSAEDVHSVLFTGTETTEYQIELGTTATAYEPYTEQTVSEQFDVSLTPTSKDTDPYLFKAVGDIYGDRLEEDIVGGTVNWNQLFESPNFADTTKWRIYNTAYGTFSATNNVGTITYNQTYAGGYNGGLTPNHAVVVQTSHKYLLQIEANADFETDIKIELGTETGQAITLTPNKWNTANWIAMRPSWNSGNIVLFKPVASQIVDGSKIQFRNATIIDLTAMFGSTIADYVYSLEQATAGSGIAWLKSYRFFTKPYYEYDAGTLKSVNPTAHKTVGVNQWDEEWEVGGYNVSTGEKTTATNRIRSKNLIPVVPNTRYFINVGYAVSCCYDANGNYLRSTPYAYTSITGTYYLDIPSDAYFITFNMGVSYGTTYNNDICINISNSEVNGQYFPYEEHTYDLGNVPLYGVFQLENNKLKAYGDVRHAEGGTDRKFGLVDLGSLTWDLSSDGYFRTDVSGAKLPVDLNQIPSMICKYPAVPAYDLVYNTDGKFDKTASISSSTGKLLIRDSTYSDAATFKTAMSGVMLCYEKATPTTEQTDPFEQIQEVSKYGTLEYVTTNNVPVGHNTTYMTRDVFGGYIDLVSGVLTVDKVLGDFGDYTWAYNSTRDAFFTSIPNSTWFSGINMISDRYEYLGTISDSAIASANTGSFGCGSYNGIQLKVKNTAYNNAATFKTAMTGAKFAYELATPLTYQLTPKQIQTLVGTNNVWSEQGDIELSYHIPITNLLVKRQDVDDVSGNWLTLYSQPIEQASDMDFTFIDFLNQYGKTYKYALVPLLTQTQSGVEVEVEGGYTVSDEVQSIFDGVFISDSTGSQKCKANVGYGNVNMNQSVGSITPIGSQYPIIVTNSNNRYHNGSISGMIVPDDYYYNGNLSRIDMVNKRNELEQFLTNKRAKIIKDWNSNIWLVMIMDNIDCSFDNNYGMGIVTFNANWLEIGDPTNQEDLQATGLVDVGGV